MGRGCLAGPVVAAAVILPDVQSIDDLPGKSANPLKHTSPLLKKWLPDWANKVADSKLLTPSTREVLGPQIQSWVKCWAIGVASVEEIDRLNIHVASHLAMLRAVEGLAQQPDHVLIDGKFLPKGESLKFKMTAIIKGDQQCLSIACASILAKVWRDSQMVKYYDERFPGYGFAAHKGYGTAVHNRALLEKGPCEIHRTTFAPVRELLKSQSLYSKKKPEPQNEDTSERESQLTLI